MILNTYEVNMLVGLHPQGLWTVVLLHIATIEHNTNHQLDVDVQKDEAARLRSYNQQMEKHEQRMAGLVL